MEYGSLIENGKAYEINTPTTPGAWSNVLFNDEYFMEVDSTLQGQGYSVKDFARSNVFEKYRYFYLKDRCTDRVWCSNHTPLSLKPDSEIFETTPFN